MKYYSIKVWDKNGAVYDHPNAFAMNYPLKIDTDKAWNSIEECDQSEADFYCDFEELVNDSEEAHRISPTKIAETKYSKMDITKIQPLGLGQSKIIDALKNI